MESLSAGRMQNVYSGLMSSISASVRNIRVKQTEEYQPNRFSGNVDKIPFGQFSLGAYAVSYLEPQVLFSIHHLRENENSEQLKKHSTEKESVQDWDEQTAQTVANNDNTIDVTFWESLQNMITAPNAEAVAGIYGRNNNILSILPQETFWGKGFAMGEVKYANDTYSFNYKVANDAPSMTIEYMHKNNRSFDYRV